MVSVHKFQRQYRRSDVLDFTRGLLSYVEDEKEPTPESIIWIGLRNDENGDTVHDLQLGGTKMRLVDIVGILETIKHHLLTDNFIYENAED